MEPRFPLNYFEFFEIPHHLSIDLKDLEKRFYALSRKWHPDRFARAGASDQQAAMDASAILNDGYRTLRDPILRAQYLLKENSFDVGEQHSKDVPPELLEEVFELNMALEEADQEAIASSRTRFLAMQQELDGGLNTAFTRYDAHQDRAVLADIRALLNRRKYITNLVDKTESPCSR